jgi:hypothetical protein
MVGAGAMDQEAFAFQPFHGHSAVHDDAGNGRMDGIGCPGAYQSLE